jgi:uncharacterized protein
MTDFRQIGMPRRTFLREAGAAALGTGMLCGSEALGETETPQQEPSGLSKRTLGRTGLDVTDISFGGIQIQHERLLDIAIDRGINLVHTSPGYGAGRSIRLFGKVMARRRDEIFLALKQNPVGGIDDALKTLNTDHVDLLVPPMHSVEAINDPELPGAYQKLKDEGKIRFSGYACHQNTAAVMERSVDLAFFDFMLIAYNLANREQLDPILARAKKEQNMGFMAMKAAKNVKGNEHPTVFKSLLSNPQVDTLLVGMASFAEVERNVAISGRRTGMLDRLRLLDYADVPLTACAMCGTCDVCPRGVAVADVLRSGLYLNRGEPDLAAATYRELGSRDMSSCDDCGQCEASCPRHRAVRAELSTIHTALA